MERILQSIDCHLATLVNFTDEVRAEKRCDTAVTRNDLHAAEARLMFAIISVRTFSPDEQTALESIVLRANRIARRINRLDASTP